jgi:phage shock protein E
MSFFRTKRPDLKEIAKNTSVQFIDVRTPEEFANGHIDRAKNIPLHLIGSRYKEINGIGEQPVIFYCRSGNRSAQAVSYLHKLGYKNIYNGGALEDVQLLVK